MLKKLLLLILTTLTISTSVKANDSKYTLYYFYNDFRCANCIKFEEYTSEIAPTLPVEFKLINTSDDENKLYLMAYKLYTKSVVITDDKGNFKNLEGIWENLGDEDDFKDYIKEEVNEFIKENK